MPRTTKPLTDTQVRQTKQTIYDGGGLQLRVSASGTKTWLFNYAKPHTKRRTNISFGTYPIVTLTSARTKREEAKKLLSKQLDPKEYWAQHDELQKASIENTFGKFAEKWLNLKHQQVKEITYIKAKKVLNKHILPNFSSIPIAEIRPKPVIDYLQPLVDEGKLETVKQICRYINEIMRYALAAGAIEFNCLSDVTRLFPSPKVKHHPTIRPEELGEFLSSLMSAKIKEQTRLMVLWQLHTITRPAETAKARWEDIDRDNCVWTIPENKMNRSHRIPLSTEAMSLLDAIEKCGYKREYLFPGQVNPRSHANTESANMAIKRMGYKGRLVSHGIRAIASTALHEQDFNPDAIESALSHLVGSQVARAYNRSDYFEQRKDIMEWWSKFITSSQKSRDEA